MGPDNDRDGNHDEREDLCDSNLEFITFENEVSNFSDPKKSISDRKELKQYLDEVLNKTYELVKEYQRLDVDINMVKSYLIESHSKIKNLHNLDSYQIDVQETRDPTLFIIKFKKEGWPNYCNLYADTFDERFWTIHTVEKSSLVDPLINKIAKDQIKKDHIWFPSQYMEKFGLKGITKNITIQHRELINDEPPVGDLSMKFSGSSTGSVLELLRKLPEIRAIIQSSSNIELSRILRVSEDLAHSSPISGIGIKYIVENQELHKYVLDDITFTGKFTARGGNSIDGHLHLLRKAKDNYAATIKFIEDEIAMGLEKSHPLRMTGNPIEIILSRPIENLNTFSDLLISCKQPFRLLGFPRYESDDFVAINGVDLHTGGRLNLEISNNWIRLYLLKGSCGNTVARFYSLMQHYYDSNAKLEGIEYGELF